MGLTLLGLAKLIYFHSITDRSGGGDVIVTEISIFSQNQLLCTNDIVVQYWFRAINMGGY